MKTQTFVFLFAVVATVALAQGRGYGPGPHYDSNSETTINGTIEEIKTLNTMCQSGTHLVVKTGTGDLEVALGPSKFLSDQNLDLKKGDQVQVVGAKTTTRQGEMFVARQITSSNKAVTLRRADGTPAWPRGMCRQ